MKRLVLFLTFTSILASCGKNKEIYLFKKGSAEESAYKEALAKRCLESNPKLLKNLEASNNFNNFFPNNTSDRYIKIARKFDQTSKTSGKADSDNKQSEIYYQYIRMQKTSDSEMRVSVSSSKDVSYQGESQAVPYSFLYTSDDNKTMWKYIVDNVCSKKYGKNLGSNKEYFDYTHTRTLKTDSSVEGTFNKQDDLFLVKTNFPIILSRWNAKTVKTTADNEEGELVTKTYTHSIPSAFKDITSETGFNCSENTTCNKLLGNIQECRLEVNVDHVDSDDPKVFLTKTRVNCSAEE